jgi:mRNA interferase MazF
MVRRRRAVPVHGPADLEAAARGRAVEETLSEKTGQTVLSMVTRGVRSAWPSDVRIGDLETAGLPKPSLVRARIGTVENRFIARRIGALSQADCDAVLRSFHEILVTF